MRDGATFHSTTYPFTHLRAYYLFLSPTRVADAGNQALVGQLPKADPANAELPIHGTRPATQPAAVFATGAEFRRLLRLGDLRFTGHRRLFPCVIPKLSDGTFAPEGHAKATQQLACLVIRAG